MKDDKDLQLLEVSKELQEVVQSSTKLRDFATQFTEIAGSLGIIVIMNAQTLEITGSIGEDKDAVKQLVDALNTGLDSLLEDDIEMVEESMALEMLLIQYLDYFKKKLSNSKKRMNRVN